MPLKNDRLIRALLRQQVDVTPVWLMRQAGRYLPEYRALRKKAGDFMTMCKTPELACEITLQPLRRFDLDAAIIFSDILTIPDAMGLGLSFKEGEGPQFAKPIRTAKDVAAIQVPDIEKLNYVMQAIQLVKKELADKLPLIGFSGSPWTLASYMIEGSSSKNFSLIKRMLFNEPDLLKQLLQTLSDSVVAYLNAQITAGADAVMIFDTWGGVLTPRDYQLFSLHYMQQICQRLQRQHHNKIIPVILFTKNGGQWLEQIAESGCDAIGIDWTTNIGEARQRVGNKVALQGNMDPSILYAKPERIREEVVTILQDYGIGPGHVFNLGHGITPDVPPEHVQAMVEAVHNTQHQVLL
jgi:uroporphyrinogen decarboxylase